MNKKLTDKEFKPPKKGMFLETTTISMNGKKPIVKKRIVERKILTDKEVIELLLDQLYRLEGVLGKYNCQHGGTKCNFQVNCHRLIREEINYLRKFIKTKEEKE